MISADSMLMAFTRAVAISDAAALDCLSDLPALVATRVERGATRARPEPFFAELGRHLLAGDTALHVAAGAYRCDTTRRLIAMGADVRARNRRGAEPLHAASVGAPGASWWNPTAQAETIAHLVATGADPNALDGDGVAPLHRAVRTRCAAAVAALLAVGADVNLTNKGGSTPMRLATLTTGRSGSGSPEAKAEQAEILRLLTVRSAAV